MSWLKKSDDSNDDPLIIGLCRRPSDKYMVLGIMLELELYSAKHRTDGFLPAMVVNALPRGWRSKFLDPPHGGTALIHRRGDSCDCMKDLPWPDGPWDYYCHGYLDDNPTKEQQDLRDAKKRERNSPELQMLVWVRDRGFCRYCAEACRPFADNTSGSGAVLDHIDPDKVCGIDNLALAHKSCNSAKGNRTPERWGRNLSPIPAGRAPIPHPGEHGSSERAAYEAAYKATRSATGSATRSATHASMPARDGTGLDGQPNTEPDPAQPATAQRNVYHDGDLHPAHHGGRADPTDLPAAKPPAQPPAQRPAEPPATGPPKDTWLGTGKRVDSKRACRFCGTLVPAGREIDFCSQTCINEFHEM